MAPRDSNSQTGPPLTGHLLAARWFQTKSGLWAPSSIADLAVEIQPSLPPGYELEPEGLAVATSSDPADPLRGLYVYATEQVLELPSTTWEELRELVSDLPAEPAVAILSMAQAALWRRPTDQGLHLALDVAFFGRARVTQLLAAWLRKAAHHLIFTEQALVALQRMVLDLGGEGTTLTEEQMTRLRRAVLAIGNFVGADSRQLRHSTRNPSWLSYLTQTYAYYARDNLGSALGRSRLLFVRLAEELSPDDVATYAPLDRWMKEFTGLSVDEQLTLGFTLLASTRIIDHDVAPEVIREGRLLDDAVRLLGLDEQRATAADQLLVSSRSDLARAIGDTSTSAAHDQVTFNQHPFMRLSDGRLLLLSPRAIHNWLTSGLYYRLLDAAKAAEGEAGINRFTAYVGHLVERYVLELVKSAHPPPRLPTAGRVVGERAYGKQGAKTSDVAVVYPHEVVLLEVSSPRLTWASRNESDGQAIERDLWRIVGRRVEQLGQTIEAIKPVDTRRQPRARLLDLDGTKVARFRPVIVTVEPVHMTPPMQDYLAERHPNWPGRTDVEPLEIMDLEDLEALISLVETGHSLSRLLATKQAQVGNGIDVGQWLKQALRRPEMTRPSYLNQALREVLDCTGDLLGVPRQDWSETDRNGEAA